MNSKINLVLVTFNHEDFIQDAVLSCLRQDYTPLRIILSDDCSSDRTFDIITEIVAAYNGPHEVVVNRNDENRYLDHIPDILPLIDSEFVVWAAGDDVQTPGRVSALAQIWRETGASLVGSGARMIDQDGRVLGVHNVHDDAASMMSLEYFLKTGYNPTCFGASLACHRDVLFSFPSRNLGSRNEDFYWPWRALLLNGGAHTNALLLDWRKHGTNASLAFKLERAETELEKMLVQERDLLNRIANWHLVIDDANHARRTLKKEPPLSEIGGAAFNHIYTLIAAWRPLRTKIANTKTGVW